MEIKRSVRFALEKRKKDGELITENVPIRMYVNYNGKRVDFSTGYRTDAKKWDEKAGKVLKGCTNKLKQTASDINSALAEYEAAVNEVFKVYETENAVPSPARLRESFNEKLHSGKVKKEYTFFEVWDMFVAALSKQNNWTVATHNKFKTLKAHLLRFNSRMTFEELTEKRLQQYIDFVRTERDMRNTTAVKHLKYLKTFLTWAEQKGYNTNAEYRSYKPNFKGTDGNSKTIVFLSKEELETLYKFTIPANKQYLNRVRDVFCFCCFTGLRYSDAYNLRASNLREGRDYGMICITTQKTADRLEIPVTRYAHEILEKYKDIPFENGKLLPVISNQKMNDYLKELCQLAGINSIVTKTYYKGTERIDEAKPKYEYMSSHAARRTFVCTALLQGIPAEVVMKITGHKSYEIMKPYIEIVDALKVREMSKFNNLF